VSEQQEVWSQLITGPHAEELLRAVMERVARSLSDMIGQIVTNSLPVVKTIPISEVVARAGAPEAEIVGIYLNIEHGLRGRVILILPFNFALNLVDLVMDAPRGMTTRLGLEERSALAEVGNLMLSYFLNSVVELTGRVDVLQPSPPSVVVDMLGAILNLCVTSAAAVSDDLLVIETMFKDLVRTVQFRFWVLPDPTIDWVSILGEVN
jgi:chemotaxis protein CheC